MARYAVIYDACVLYPAPLRDLLIQLATANLFRAQWSDDIQEEWINALLREQRHTPPPKRLVSELIASADQEHSFRIKFAALTGLRASEQWALRWHHLDSRRGYIRVETKVEEYTKKESATKTKAGDREVPISKDLLSCLQKRKDRSGALPTDLIFPGPNGGYTVHASERQYLYRRFDAVKENWPADAVGTSRPRWHDLRHFAISCWIEAGLPPKAIQKFAGHASIQTTMDRYGHLFPNEDHRTAMDAVVSGIFDKQ